MYSVRYKIIRRDLYQWNPIYMDVGDAHAVFAEPTRIHKKWAGSRYSRSATPRGSAVAINSPGNDGAFTAENREFRNYTLKYSRRRPRSRVRYSFFMPLPRTRCPGALCMKLGHSIDHWKKNNCTWLHIMSVVYSIKLADGLPYILNWQPAFASLFIWYTYKNFPGLSLILFVKTASTSAPWFRRS